jgi:ATP-dependent DNA helicase RecG
MMNAVGRRNRTKFRDGLVKPLIEAGWLEPTIPDKPRSRLQRYRTTAAGLDVLAKEEEQADQP